MIESISSEGKVGLVPVACWVTLGSMAKGLQARLCLKERMLAKLGVGPLVEQLTHHPALAGLVPARPCLDSRRVPVGHGRRPSGASTRNSSSVSLLVGHVLRSGLTLQNRIETDHRRRFEGQGHPFTGANGAGGSRWG